MDIVQTLLVVLSLVIFICFDWGIKKAVSSKDFDSRIISRGRVFFVLWYAILTYVSSKNYFESESSFPTGYVVLLATVLFLVFVISITKIGEALSHLDWDYLVGFHGIKVFAEITLYIASLNQLVPPHLTFMGLNYTIVSGIFALFMLPGLSRRPKLSLVKLWNRLSLILIFIYLGLEFVSLESSFQYFQTPLHPSWVQQVPYVYFLGIYILFSLLGHFVISKKLRNYD